MLSQVEKSAERENFKIGLLKKLKNNFMFETNFDTNDAEDMILYKNIESQIKGLEELFNYEEEYFCLNCENEISFKEYLSTICDNCYWRNILDADPAVDIDPIVLIREKVNEYDIQMCYPEIEEKDLENIPEGMKEAVTYYFKESQKLPKKYYDNILHNLYEKDVNKFEDLAKKYKNKAKLAWFFQQTNFLK